MAIRSLTIILGLVAVGLPLSAYAFQYPGMDLQFVAPVSTEKLLSAKFVKAQPVEVVAWLNAQEISVAADATVLGRVGLVTASFTDQAVEDAMKILGKAMGGTFIERSDTWLFRSNRTSKKVPVNKTVARGGGKTGKMVCAPQKPE